MATLLDLQDTFSQWREKINDIVSEVNTNSSTLSDIVAELESPTPFGVSGVSGLTVSMVGGRVRDGSVIETIADQNVTLLPSVTNVVAIYKKSGETAELRVYEISALPSSYVIPVYAFTTDGTDVLTASDLRTQFNTGAGGSGGTAGAAGSILQFDKIIDTNVTIPADKNGLSIDPTISPGVTVTVEPGSVWVVL